MSNPTGLIAGAPQTMSVSVDSNLTSKENHFVKLDATDDGVVNIAEDSSAPAFVLANGGDGSTTPFMSSVAIGGVVKIKLGGAANAGDKLCPTTGGEAIVTITDKQHYSLIALMTGAQNDEILAVVAFGTVSAT